MTIVLDLATVGLGIMAIVIMVIMVISMNKMLVLLGANRPTVAMTRKDEKKKLPIEAMKEIPKGKVVQMTSEREATIYKKMKDDQ